MQIDILIIKRIISALKEYQVLAADHPDAGMQDVEWVLEYLERKLLEA